MNNGIKSGIRPVMVDGQSLPTATADVRRFPHNLGRPPRRVSVLCVSEDLGYTPGFRIDIYAVISDAADNRLYTVAWTESEVLIGCSNANAGRIMPRAGGASSNMDRGKWRFEVDLT